MAVVSVYETDTSRELKDSVTGDTGVRTFVVVLNAVSDGPSVAKTADDGDRAIPVLGSAHDKNTAITAKRIDPVKTDSRLIFLVNVYYSASSTSTIPEADPLDDPWDIEWGSTTIKEVIEKTRTDVSSLTAGNDVGVAANVAVLNAAGEWFDALEEDAPLMLCTLAKNFAAYDVAEAGLWMNSINDAAITIAGYVAPKWVAKLITYHGVKQNDRGSAYWKVTYRLLFNEELWVRRVLNRGKNWYKVADDKLYPIKLAGGKPVEEPHLLNTDGTYGFHPTANYRLFGSIKEKAFSTLSLPTAM